MTTRISRHSSRLTALLMGVACTLVAGVVSGLALGAFATGPVRSPAVDSTGWISAAQAAEPVQPVTIHDPDVPAATTIAPPVRMARYGGRLVVCTDCTTPVWQPQAAAPVRTTYSTTEPAHNRPVDEDGEPTYSSEHDGVAVYVGGHATQG